MQDPNPKVAGQGVAKLRAAGIRVEVGLCAAEAEAINRGFFRRMRGGRPFVTAKIAMSLDGRTAMASGESQWITGESARADVQRLRACASAVLTGIGTVVADDPRLTVREARLGQAGMRQPLRVMVDSHLRALPSARLFAEPGDTLLVTAETDDSRYASYLGVGAQVLALPASDGRVDLPALLDELARRGVNEVLVEAGQVLNGALLAQGLVDEVVFYVAPKVLGAAARGAFSLPGVDRMSDAIDFRVLDIRAVGADWRVLAAPVYVQAKE